MSRKKVFLTFFLIFFLFIIAAVLVVSFSVRPFVTERITDALSRIFKEDNDNIHFEIGESGHGIFKPFKTQGTTLSVGDDIEVFLGQADFSVSIWQALRIFAGKPVENIQINVDDISFNYHKLSGTVTSSSFQLVLEGADPYALNFSEAVIKFDSGLEGSEFSFHNSSVRFFTQREGLFIVADGTVLESRNFELAVERVAGTNNIELSLDDDLRLECSASGDFSDVFIDAFYHDFLIEFEGSLEKDTYAPSGTVEVKSVNDDDLNVSVYLEADDLTHIRYFSTEVLFRDTPVSVTGSLEIGRDKLIYVDSDVGIEDAVIPFAFSFDPRSSALKSVTDDYSLAVTLDKKKVSGSVTFTDMSLLSDNINLNLNGSFDVDANFENGDFICSSDNVIFSIDERISFSFACKFSNKMFHFEQLKCNFADSVYDFSGALDLSLYPGNTVVSCDFEDKNGDTQILFNLFDSRYRADILIDAVDVFSVSALGNVGDGFFADCSVLGLNFESQYKDNVVYIYNGEGNLGFYNLKSFGSILDLKNRTLKADISFENILHNKDGDVVQGADVSVSAELDSLVMSALSLAGINVNANFGITVKNAHLGNYTIADNSFDVILSGNKLIFNGEYINGQFDFDSTLFSLKLDSTLLLGFSANGKVDSDGNVDVVLENISIPIGLFNQYFDYPQVKVDNGILYGSLCVEGSIRDPNFYGTLFANNIDVTALWVPDQILSVKNAAVSFYNHDIYINRTPFYGRNTVNGNSFVADISGLLQFDKFRLVSLEGNINLNEDPTEVRIQIYSDGFKFDISSDATGNIILWYRDKVFGIDGEVYADNMKVAIDQFSHEDFVARSLWVKKISANIVLNTGNNVELYYPDSPNPFITIKATQGNALELHFDKVHEKFTADGNLAFDKGQIYYFQNNFNITEGDVHFRNNEMRLDFTAKLKEFDSSGKSFDILMIVNNGSLTDLTPHFESSLMLSENEIIEILGKSAISPESSMASVAVNASDFVTKIGVVKAVDTFDLSASVRQALGLDIFSMRSGVFKSILVDAFMNFDEEESLLAHYLDGTTIYAGKYLGYGIFAKATVLLKKAERGTKDVSGSFLSSSLNLDFEVSFDWSNPLGNFSIFTSPEELSVFDILDTIGFSFSKRISF